LIVKPGLWPGLAETNYKRRRAVKIYQGANGTVMEFDVQDQTEREKADEILSDIRSIGGTAVNQDGRVVTHIKVEDREVDLLPPTVGG
jgi:hypothetical protein